MCEASLRLVRKTHFSFHFKLLVSSGPQNNHWSNAHEQAATSKLEQSYGDREEILASYR